MFSIKGGGPGVLNYHNDTGKMFGDFKPYNMKKTYYSVESCASGTCMYEVEEPEPEQTEELVVPKPEQDVANNKSVVVVSNPKLKHVHDNDIDDAHLRDDVHSGGQDFPKNKPARKLFVPKKIAHEDEIVTILRKLIEKKMINSK